MSRPRSESGGPAAAASNRRRRALTYDDLPPEMKDAIQDYLRHTNESLRAAVKEFFEDKAAAEREWGKIGTWDVGRLTDMSELARGLVLEVFLDRRAQGLVREGHVVLDGLLHLGGQVVVGQGPPAAAPAHHAGRGAV